MESSAKEKSPHRTSKKAEAAVLPNYVLRLYVTGSTQRSAHAIMNIRRICEDHLKGRYDLEVIDIYQQPVLAAGEQILAAPTLIKKLPLPLRRFIGDMTNKERLLVGLDLVNLEGEKKQASTPT